MMADSRILVYAPNWLGDSVMSIPAVRLLNRAYPSCRITVLAVERLAGLWEMCDCVDEVKYLAPGLPGTLQASRMLRREGFRSAFILPNSFRSALIPFLAGIPVRIGPAGRWRRGMLTRVIPLRGDLICHQSLEYENVMEVSGEVAMPLLDISEELKSRALALAGLTGEMPLLVALLPGAARGPSKRWPASHFAELGRMMACMDGVRVILMGGRQEIGLCAGICDSIGRGCIDLAGRTGIQEFAALLSLCSCVVANDSGGMHLAAAAGAPVTALFGVTDPARTGPMGENHDIIIGDCETRSRDVKRDSEFARQVLHGIKPGRVFEAARVHLEQSARMTRKGS